LLFCFNIKKNKSLLLFTLHVLLHWPLVYGHQGCGEEGEAWRVGLEVCHGVRLLKRGWVHEVSLDGARLVHSISGRDVRLEERGGFDETVFLRVLFLFLLPFFYNLFLTLRGNVAVFLNVRT